jgi:hypothetical protein
MEAETNENGPTSIGPCLSFNGLQKDRSRRPSWEERRIDELKLKCPITGAPPAPLCE